MPADYKNLGKLAREKNGNWEFREFLKLYDELSDDELDELVSKLA